MWPQIIAMIVAAAMQQKASSDAARRQKEQAVLAQQRQLAAQNEATQVASKKAAEFDAPQRAEKQDQIAQDLTANYQQQIAAPQVTAQGVQVGSTVPEAAAGADYSLARAKEQAKTTASLHALAGLMGRIGSTSELRRREAVGIGDTAGTIGRIQTGANNIWQADQAGVQAAGRPDPWLQIGAGALNAYGMSGLMASGLGGTGAGAAPTTGDFARMDRAAAWLK
jgi:hypothetical protein